MEDTVNPDPICPCGAWYNFTCMCSSAEVKAFKAGRAWQAKASPKAVIDHTVPPRVTEDMTSEEAYEMRLWSLQVCMTTWSGDWSEDKRLAWLYGIVVGWDDESLAELTKDFGWDADTVERFITLMPRDRNS